MIFLAVTMLVHSHFSSVPVFNGLNFSQWSEQIHFYLGVMDLDLALRVEKPADNTVMSTAEEKNHYKTWERSNILSLMYMRMSIANNIKAALPKTDIASLPISLWTYALKTAMYLQNRVPSKAVQKTPFELWMGRKPSLRHLHVWGCPT